MSNIDADNIVYKKWEDGRARKAIKRKCDYCGQEYKATLHHLESGRGKFCSRSCASKHREEQKLMKNVMRGKIEAKNLSWEKSLAYLSGLIASDGTLQKGSSRVNFTSKDKELIDQFRIIAHNFVDKPHEPKKICSSHNPYWITGFNNWKLSIFLRDVGIRPNKSKTISKISIPDTYFSDFLRGEIDGDGSFSQVDDTFVISISSGSSEFLLFLKTRINSIITGRSNGSIYEDRGSYILNFGLFDSFDIYHAIYNQADYYLNRKKMKAEKFFSDYPNTLKEFRKQRKLQLYSYNPRNRKLSVADTIEIIKKYHEDDLTYMDLADLFDVSFKTIGNVINFDHWTTKELVS